MLLTEIGMHMMGYNNLVVTDQFAQSTKAAIRLCELGYIQLTHAAIIYEACSTRMPELYI